MKLVGISLKPWLILTYIKCSSHLGKICEKIYKVQIKYVNLSVQSICYETLWTLTFFFSFFLILYFFSLEFIFLFIDDEEAHDIAVT